MVISFLSADARAILGGKFNLFKSSSRSKRGQKIELFERIELLDVSLAISRARLVKNAFSPAGVENAAAAETGHRVGKLCRAAPVFLRPINHLFGKMC